MEKTKASKPATSKSKSKENKTQSRRGQVVEKGKEATKVTRNSHSQKRTQDKKKTSNSVVLPAGPRVPEKENAPKAENPEKLDERMKKRAKKELKVEPTQDDEQPKGSKEPAKEPTKEPTKEPVKELAKEDISSLNIKEESRRPVKMDDGYEDFGPGAASS